MSERIVELGPGIPGWVLRLALLLVGGAAVYVQRADGVVVLVVFGVLALVAAAVPASPAPALLISVIALAVTLSSGSPLRPTVLAEIPLLHLEHVLAAITALLPMRAVVRGSALLAPARRFVIIQFSVFAVAGLAEMLPTTENSIFVEVVGLLAAVGLVGLAISALTRSK